MSGVVWAIGINDAAMLAVWLGIGMVIGRRLATREADPIWRAGLRQDCPVCGVKKGHECRTDDENRRTQHIARWRA